MRANDATLFCLLLIFHLPLLLLRHLLLLLLLLLPLLPCKSS
jgi:hypothetical protein